MCKEKPHDDPVTPGQSESIVAVKQSDTAATSVLKLSMTNLLCPVFEDSGLATLKLIINSQ